MEADKKIREPYTPENTPNPPQIIDPNKNEQPGGSDPTRADKKGPEQSKTKKGNTKPSEPVHKEKLGESETE